MCLCVSCVGYCVVLYGVCLFLFVYYMCVLCAFACFACLAGDVLRDVLCVFRMFACVCLLTCPCDVCMMYGVLLYGLLLCCFVFVREGIDLLVWIVCD